MEKNAIAAFYDSHVRELADQHKAPVRKQLEAAFLEKQPVDPDDVDPWFEKSFHKAPISLDTVLLNQLHGMKAMIRDAFTPPEAQ